jgi:hypothetical protein
MRMPFGRTAAFLTFASAIAPVRMQAQHSGHGMTDTDTAMRSPVHVMVQAIPLVTRAAPTAGGSVRSQLAVSQALVMARAGFWHERAVIATTLDAEGLTIPNGELDTGAYGEGFVDRRHPHTYVHELMLTGGQSIGAVTYSASAGRGFAPFGTDDPMMRPIEKFPVNHHLSQVLERLAAIGALHVGPAIVEAATFGGDEPTQPSSVPRLDRFGDSWSVRATVLPTRATELQASYARVASPEDASGAGLGQRKRSVSARYISTRGARYLFAEWARTVEHDASRNEDAFGYESALVEGAVRAGPLGIALRLEQSDRPEEDRLVQPFRTPRPSPDLSINGITQWRVATLQLAAPGTSFHDISGIPFMEVARLWASAHDARSVATPDRLYGTSNLWMLTVGMRLRAGEAHARMGRYGAADVGGPAIGTLGSGNTALHTH